ncbi:MAG: TIR domain-containing protein [Anaerolineales bacterium]|nr:MAG: TIR domain-containing protein [Anaerolineales bacterium]
MTKIKQVFISHATTDAEFAHRLARDLERLGVQVWIAPESIRPGEGWVEAIERGLEESSHVVVLTPAALESPWVRKETNVAIAQERRGQIEVIPLDVEPCAVPLLWGSYQMVSFRGEYEAGLSQLAGILGVRVIPPEPVRPPGQGPPYGAMPEAQVTALKEEEIGARRREEGPQEPTLEQVLPFEPEMVLIPAGEFLMGSDPGADKDAVDWEQPQHPLYLPDYYLARTPVTNAQYAAFVQATGHEQPKHWKGGQPPRGKEDHPVVRISWHHVVAYCRWLAEVSGQPYGLPSEAQWEKGARGDDGRIWPWHNRWDAKRCNSAEGGQGDTTPVGAYADGASPYGLLDVAGNVWQWTRSLWGEHWTKPSFKYPYDAADGREDLDAPDSVLRVLRGGAFSYLRGLVRCAYRHRSYPHYFSGYIGFRVVLVAPGFPSGL